MKEKSSALYNSINTMPKLLLISLVVIFAGQYPIGLLWGSSTIELKLNQGFRPISATERLNGEYTYQLLFADIERKIYLIQKNSERHADYLYLGVYHGTGDIKEVAFVMKNDLLMPADHSPLTLFYPFDCLGCDAEIQGNTTTSRACAIQIFPRHDETLLYLDQRFSDGGTGGHHDGIARKYLIITNEHIYITTENHVTTYFYIGYPRVYGTWRAGYMGYSHCYDMTVSLKNEEVIVTCMKQEFQMEDLFATSELVENSEDKTPNGWWGESFTLTHFHVPREPIYQYQQEMKTFPLKVID